MNGTYSSLSIFCIIFTVAELGEMLPIRVQSGKRKTPRNKFYCNWDKKSGVHHREDADTEADARGKMLIYLLENNLLNNNQTS